MLSHDGIYHDLFTNCFGPLDLALDEIQEGGFKIKRWRRD